jgi:hypothetical protein
LRDAKQADELQRAVELVRACAPDLSDEAIAQSIRRLSPTTSLSTWLERLLRRATRFPNRPPIDDADPDFLVLGTAEALRNKGRSFQNCLNSRLAAVALGRAAYLEWKHGPAIVELIGLSGGNWMLEGAWGPKNCQPDPEMVWAIRRRLSSRGVLLPIQHVEGKAQTGEAKLLGIYDFGFDLDFLSELEEPIATA